MDGGSVDGTINILEKYSAHISYWESKPDKGVYHAWNKGLNVASGDWICFIGSDDFLIADTVLTSAVQYLNRAEQKGINYVYGKVGVFSHEHGKIVAYVNTPWQQFKKDIRQGKFIFHSGSFHHRKLFDRQGYFDESLRFVGDFELIWREVKDNGAFFMDMATIAMGFGGLTMSMDKKKRMLKEALFVCRKHNISKFPVFIMGMRIKIGLYAALKKIIGETLAYRLGYYYSTIRKKAPIEYR